MYCIGIRLEELNKTTENLRISVISGQIRIGLLPNTCPEYIADDVTFPKLFSPLHLNFVREGQ